MSRKIVAVDDSDIARELVVATLADFGYDTVETYSDPRQALEILSSRNETPDLVLLDIMMPGMDGIELCARLRQVEAWRDVPIVMLTSRTDKGSLSRAFMAGANDYLMKPFDRVEFQARLKAQLRLKSELDRRKAPQETAGRTAGGVRRSHVPGLLGDQHTLLDALTTLDGTEALCVYALSIDALSSNMADFTPEDREAIIAEVSRRLAAIEMPAGDILVRWEDESFCGASLGRSAAEMTARLERISEQVEATLAGMGSRLRGGETTLSIALSVGGAGSRASEVLGDAFRALEGMRGEATGTIRVAERHDA
ncbi:response regulator [Limimaricola pyoseonensis]|uniref:Response regulator receiver domain-containing protein n=1 Tax=Limimaricola pyoseonensis TaxID=521013 RepID=A0A1G7JIK4_9RHOB|nr:response regulator [Limimaricola pyoseonensis]SDF24748.1 Response regulator receiver domain-containing protein [Limimaricola pyoseonensis]